MPVCATGRKLSSSTVQYSRTCLTNGSGAADLSAAEHSNDQVPGALALVRGLPGDADGRDVPQRQPRLQLQHGGRTRRPPAPNSTRLD